MRHEDLFLINISIFYYNTIQKIILCWVQYIYPFNLYQHNIISILLLCNTFYNCICIINPKLQSKDFL